MAKRKKKPIIETPVFPTAEQLRNGCFDRDFITHAETNTKTMAYRNRDSSILDRWFKEGGPGFGHAEHRVIADCQTFWARMGSQRLTGQYGERIAAATHGNGYSAQEAADEIAFRRKLVPAKYFDVFENVVRHNEPAGVSASHFYKSPTQQIAAAKVIVGFVAGIIAMKLGY